MKFMMLVIPQGYESAAPGTLPEAEAVEKMMVYNRELEAAGIVRDANGLHPPAEGVRVKLGDGEPTVTDGPFSESKECIGGYWIIEVASKAEAIAWARKVPAVEPMQIELRQIQEASEWPDDVREAAEGFDRIQAS